MDERNGNRILVAGTGPVGLVAALLLADLGLPVTLVGPPARIDDRRTTALMQPALDVLQSIDILEALRPQAAPLKTMRIVDATTRLFRSPPVTFRSSEIGAEWFGLNIPNTVLNAALEASVGARPSIKWLKCLVETWDVGPDHARATLADGTILDADLVVAADGRLSPARQAAGIATHTRSYPQAALVLNFAHSREHASTSTEFHTETGPFTQVPLPGNRSSLVWVVTPGEAENLASLDLTVLSRRVEDRMQSMLGRVTVEPGHQIYPLRATLPTRFAAKRIVLVGEAAHVFPPIGAQGLNLGIRDVSDLAEIITGSSLGSVAEILSAYDRKRRPDIVARAGAVNLLNMSLLSDMLPAQLARSAGLGFIGALAPIRALFMREGLRPGSGLSSIGAALRKQVRR